MFLSLEKAVTVTLIAIIAVQYAFAVFCLMKLAVLDIPRKQYVLWNIFILLAFFVGGIAFLIYYFRVKDTKRVPPYVPPSEAKPEEEQSDKEQEAQPEQQEKEDAEQPEPQKEEENR